MENDRELRSGGRTDLIVKLQIVSPQELSQIEQNCYEKIQANSSFNPRSVIKTVTLLMIMNRGSPMLGILWDKIRLENLFFCTYHLFFQLISN